MDYSKFILPIKGALDGTGVLVGDLFITAGHVVMAFSSPSVNIDGETHYLSSKNRIYINNNSSKRSDGYDLAVYKLENVESPLVFSDDTPDMNANLINLSYEHVSEANPNYSGGFLESPSIEKWVLEINHGHAIRSIDNYFECLMDNELCEGRSGSPLIVGNKVFGILCGDKDNKKSSKKVLFLSSKSIANLIKDLL